MDRIGEHPALNAYTQCQTGPFILEHDQSRHGLNGHLAGKEKKMIHNVHVNDVVMKDADTILRRDNTVRYLLQLEPQRFLYEFYKVAGVKPTVDHGYEGWERSDAVNFRGHFFGHYMSALALALCSVSDETTRAKIHELVTECVDGLSRVQQTYADKHPERAGYLSAFREVALDEVEGRQVPDDEKENVIVPWYNLHKVLAGLLMIAEKTGFYDQQSASKARTIAINFGNYVYNRMMKLDDAHKMLKIEYGGMNDALYELFRLTHDKRHLTAATYFDEVSLFDKLADHEDVLPGLHANTTIPKLIGALHRYQIFTDSEEARQALSEQEAADLPKYLEAAKNFFDIVTQHHTFVTGGNSQEEHFHEPDQLYHYAELADGGKTCETCNTYNMLKLARELFRTTKDKKYLDYYEQTYTNAILGSQNLETGMMTYFQSMAAGYNKVFNRPFDEFWCCTGTGIENFTKLSDSYYYQGSDTLYVSLYFANELHLADKNLNLQVSTDHLRHEVMLKVNKRDTAMDSGTVRLALRIPAWSDESKMTLNDEAIDQRSSDGFVYLNHIKDGDQIRLDLTMKLSIHATRDNPHYISFTYGPYVLAGLLGTYEMKRDRPDGILVRIAARDHTAASTLTTDESWPDWEKALSHVKPEVANDHLLVLTLPEVREPIEFVPYYQVYNKRYGIYFQWQQEGSEEAKARAKQIEAVNDLRRRTVAGLTNFDNNNGEFEHKLTQKNSEVGSARNRRFRVAEPNGTFGYAFDLSKADESMVLVLTLNQQLDEGKQVTIRFNDQSDSDRQVAVTSDHSADHRGFYEVQVPVPDDAKAASTIKITFSAKNGPSPRLFGIRFMNTK